MPFSWPLLSGLVMAGSTGVLLRYAIVQACIMALAQSPLATWPVGTWAANMLGCVLAGVVLGIDHAWLPPALRTVLVVGLLGGLTTYSSFMVECFSMLQAGHIARCVGYGVISLALGLILVWGGATLARCIPS